MLARLAGGQLDTYQGDKGGGDCYRGETALSVTQETL